MKHLLSILILLSLISSALGLVVDIGDSEPLNEGFNIYIIFILYGGLYLVFVWHVVKKLVQQIKIKKLQKELKDLEED